jgi:hypothetical protein
VSNDPKLDVRSEVPARRHELILGTYKALESGAGFELVNDQTPSRFGISSARSTPISSPGTILSPAPTCGASASVVPDQGGERCRR